LETDACGTLTLAARCHRSVLRADRRSNRPADGVGCAAGHGRRM